MKKIHVINAILFLILVILFGIISSLVGLNINQQNDKYKKEIGEAILLSNDTLIIIDYSMINDNFSLEDGKKVNYDLAIKNKIINN